MHTICMSSIICREPHKEKKKVLSNIDIKKKRKIREKKDEIPQPALTWWIPQGYPGWKVPHVRLPSKPPALQPVNWKDFKFIIVSFSMRAGSKQSRSEIPSFFWAYLTQYVSTVKWRIEEIIFSYNMLIKINVTINDSIWASKTAVSLCSMYSQLLIEVYLHRNGLRNCNKASFVWESQVMQASLLFLETWIYFFYATIFVSSLNSNLLFIIGN